MKNCALLFVIIERGAIISLDTQFFCTFNIGYRMVGVLCNKEISYLDC